MLTSDHRTAYAHSLVFLTATPQTHGPLTPGRTPAAVLGPPCTQNRESFTQEELEIEFDECNALIRARHGHTTVLTSNLVTCDQSLLSPSQTAMIILFPAFCFPAKDPPLSLVQSQDVLPLHPIISPIPLQAVPPSICKMIQRAFPLTGLDRHPPNPGADAVL